MSNSRRIKDIFEGSASNKASLNTGQMDFYSKFVKDLILHTFPVKENFSTLLDIGCGDGTYTTFSSKGRSKVIGLDFSEAQISGASNESNIKYVVGDFEDMDIGSLGKVDGIFSVLTFELFQRPAEAIKRCADILKDDGRLLIVIPNPKSLHMKISEGRKKSGKDPLFWNKISGDFLVDEAHRLNFTLINRGEFLKLPPSLSFRPSRFWFPMTFGLTPLIEKLWLAGSYEFVSFQK